VVVAEAAPQAAPTARKEDLFRSSVVVTGTHYSTTTLVGRIVGAAPEFHVVHEPLNAKPTLSYDSLAPDRWYQYYDDAAYPELRRALMRYMFFEDAAAHTLRRVARIREPYDVLRVGRYVTDSVPRRLRPKRAVFKDPFLVFSARTLQARDGLFVLITVRHPCAFAESLARRARQFDFRSLQQPSLLALLPEFAERIDEYATRSKPVLEQAALLWTIVYAFAQRRLVPDARTRVIRQEDIVADPQRVVGEMLAFVGASRTPAVDAFVQAAIGESDVPKPSFRDRYVQRNARETLDKWKDRLGAGDQAAVMAIAAEVAAAYGYGEPGV
jgi:hypothetical protein